MKLLLPLVPLAVVLGACGSTTTQDSPVTATRDFLEAAVVQGDGASACGYLTATERASVARAAAVRGVSCREALGAAQVRGPAGPLGSLAGVKHLDVTVRQKGKEAAVTIPTATGPRTLRLVELGAAGTDGFRPPATPWRIEAGVPALLVPRTFHGEAAQVAAAVSRLGGALRNGDVAQLCRPGTIFTPAVIQTLGGRGDLGGESCESSVESVIAGRRVPALATTAVRAEPDLAVARVRRADGRVLPVTFLRDGRRWLVSFTGDTVPLDALAGSA